MLTPATSRWVYRVRCRRLFLLSFAMYAVATVAVAQRAPSDTELRAAYCLSLVKQEIEYQQRAIAQSETLAKNAQTPERRQAQEADAALWQGMQDAAEAIRRKLEMYLTPRLPALDPGAMLAATQRGAEDWHKLFAATRCPECGNTDPGLHERRKKCFNPTWLP